MVAELNASNWVLDAAFLAANQLTSQTNVINASISTISHNVTELVAAHDSDRQQISQLNDSCEYCNVTQFVFSMYYPFAPSCLKKPSIL